MYTQNTYINTYIHTYVLKININHYEDEKGKWKIYCFPHGMCECNCVGIHNKEKKIGAERLNEKFF